MKDISFFPSLSLWEESLFPIKKRLHTLLTVLYCPCKDYNVIIRRTKMNGFVGFIEQKLMPVANKVGMQRHMVAIRKGIIATLPLTIVGSFFTILLNFPIESVAAFIEPYREVLDIPFRYTVGLLALYATFGIAFSLAKVTN